MGIAARSLGAHRSHLPLNNSKRQFFSFFFFFGPSVRPFFIFLRRLWQHCAADGDGQNGDDRLRHGGHAALPPLRLQHGRLPGHLLPMGLRQFVQMHLLQPARPSRPARVTTQNQPEIGAS
jgi:hypothetical protein